MTNEEMQSFIKAHQAKLHEHDEQFAQMGGMVYQTHQQQLFNAEQLAILTAGMLDLRDQVANYIQSCEAD